MTDPARRVRLALASARQALMDAEAELAALEEGPPIARRYVPRRRRSTDAEDVVPDALATAAEWLSTWQLAGYWGCHVNAVLYWIKHHRLEARRDGNRYLVSRASALALDASMAHWQKKQKRPA